MMNLSEEQVTIIQLHGSTTYASQFKTLYGSAKPLLMYIKACTANPLNDSGTNNVLKLLENMNLKVAEEYKGFGDGASGLTVFVERLKAKSENFDDMFSKLMLENSKSLILKL
ncbi:hypothetical protein L2E82_18136 [Cichorium intybus]|uniref:Uncharacterized protein n=1 Tax=Cichorium intybus TaxID=13427 RepID=A0ACB9F8R8_CICIN|nr:hypothetical protein L2E82_18136 [Cichorium intybus]